MGRTAGGKITKAESLTRIVLSTQVMDTTRKHTRVPGMISTGGALFTRKSPICQQSSAKYLVWFIITVGLINKSLSFFSAMNALSAAIGSRPVAHSKSGWAGNGKI